MKISTKGVYALEVITDLALYASEDNLESLKNIAARRGLSEKYLERIIKLLKQAGLVKSVRGAHGGYTISREASEITVREILTAAEGEMAPVECLTKKTDCGIDCDTCPTRDTWAGLWRVMLNTANQVTIENILDEIRKK